MHSIEALNNIAQQEKSLKHKNSSILVGVGTQSKVHFFMASGNGANFKLKEVPQDFRSNSRYDNQDIELSTNDSLYLTNDYCNIFKICDSQLRIQWTVEMCGRRKQWLDYSVEARRKQAHIF